MVLDHVDRNTLARMTRCSRQTLVDVVPRLYERYNSNAYLKKRLALGLAGGLDVCGVRIGTSWTLRSWVTEILIL